MSPCSLPTASTFVGLHTASFFSLPPPTAFLDRAPLYISGWPGICSVDQIILDLTRICLPLASRVPLGLRVWAARPAPAQWFSLSELQNFRARDDCSLHFRPRELKGPCSRPHNQLTIDEELEPRAVLTACFFPTVLQLCLYGREVSKITQHSRLVVFVRNRRVS